MSSNLVYHLLDEGEDRPTALAELFDGLRRSGALEPQVCRWKTVTRAVRNVRVLDIRIKVPELSCRWSEYDAETGAQSRLLDHFARASYRCGCWIQWQDVPENERANLPEPSSKNDEFAYAKANLGPLHSESACKLHGGYKASAKDDDQPWWTPRRCERYGGHEYVEGFVDGRRCVWCSHLWVEPCVD